MADHQVMSPERKSSRNHNAVAGESRIQDGQIASPAGNSLAGLFDQKTQRNKSPSQARKNLEI